ALLTLAVAGGTISAPSAINAANLALQTTGAAADAIASGAGSNVSISATGNAQFTTTGGLAVAHVTGTNQVDAQNVDVTGVSGATATLQAGGALAVNQAV